MRPHYKTGSLLSARDLNDEQADRLLRLRRHDRFAHGMGVVCGLHVYAAPRKLRPWTVGICPGYAIGPCGDEIEVPARVMVDIRDFLWSRPHPGGIAARLALVGVRFADNAGPAMADKPDCGCGCGGTSLAVGSAAHIHDGFAIDVVWTVDRTPAIGIDLCQGGPAPCPAAPHDPYILLAAVRLPALESIWLTDADIVQL